MICQSDPQYTMQIILYHIHSDINDLGHYAVITCINALLGKSYYCSCCDVAFNNSTSHQCRVWCNISGQDSCVAEDASTTMVCDTCYDLCHSIECMEAHKTKRGRQSSSMCHTMLFCPDCQVKLCNYKKRGWGLNKHTCGECYCFNHKFTKHPEDRHLCYMGSIHATKSQQKTPCHFIFF